MDPVLDNLIRFILEPEPEDNLLCENPYALEEPIHWSTVAEMIQSER
jgi:hypothetical protein